MNKNIKLFFLLVAAVIALAFAVVTNVEIWNMASEGHTDGFHVLMSIGNFIMELAAGYFIGRKALKKLDE